MKIKYNRKFFADTLKKTETVKGPTSRIKNRAGKGFESEVSVGRTRARGRVWPDTHEAREENARSNTLVRALGNG
ncbi:neck protein [Gordonia phage Asapag]|uniref:Uncharacterized protein n=3 Tax=Langleyhallvirinae TaxID=2732613 RepID=A0A385DZ32_9CAUD|nr:neck protein [Gordonia phage BENtherdunthat]YP_009808352.1 neck protein [Gordonia phage Phistory]YP_009819056.1 neck protein [Gordonia phage Asapag]QDK02765.1 hypothetical protein SEA_SQUIDDLY_12 [Gordonia phage Squiddly]QYC53678.1 hypothetical protein SEA_LEROY_11 [Gordonia phage Leroy]USH45507.1 hypothetical protein SEA_PHABULOSO_11 [Gordonia phage Phabuloso]WIC40207.1 hypothetical protein SEA_HOLLIDAY_11 [Gordonia phage Holliday]WKW86291.1 hypothetical protein SEA_BUDSKI_11 [Gordonia p